MYEKDFARRLSIHWCDLDKHEIVEAVGPENIAGSGLVDEADLTAAVAHVREMESCLAQSYENRDRLVTIIDEAFGLQCVQTPDEILSCLETNLTKMRFDATAAERERDEARAQAKMFCGVMEKVERLTRDRDRLAGYVRAARRLSRDAHTHLLEERPEEAARVLYQIMHTLACAVEE